VPWPNLSKGSCAHGIENLCAGKLKWMVGSTEVGWAVLILKSPPTGGAYLKHHAFQVSTNVIRFIVASAAEAKSGDLFHNCQTGIIFRSILKDMGHIQPKTPVHCDNATEVGIANSTAK
jgi:hypothetical protein